MLRSPYSKFTKDKLILRDYLAMDRTTLANERTFLAYIRTGLAMFVAGASFVHFFNSIVIQVLGWIFMPLGIITFLIGLIRYKKMKSLIPKLKENDSTESNTV